MHDKRWSYDAIADVYATDMGQSMPFDDVGWYRDVCLRERASGVVGGRVLELGCGTGRVLIELLRAGIDVFGADRSLPMLQRLHRDARALGLSPTLLQMDIAAPALSAARTATGSVPVGLVPIGAAPIGAAPIGAVPISVLQIGVVLMPYSLITYLRDPAQAESAIEGLAALLAPGGCLILDAFVPQPVTTFADFRRDYRRPHGDSFLERYKRITANADGTNRIERRYRVLDADDVVRDEFSTDETIRPYAAEEFARFGAAAGLHREALAWDYGTHLAAEGARFASVILRKPA